MSYPNYRQSPAPFAYSVAPPRQPSRRRSSPRKKKGGGFVSALPYVAAAGSIGLLSVVAIARAQSPNPNPNPGGNAALSLGSTSATAGDPMTYTIANFAAGEIVRIAFGSTLATQVTVNGSGFFTGTFTIPTSLPTNTYNVTATGLTSGKTALVQGVSITAVSNQPPDPNPPPANATALYMPLYSGAMTAAMITNNKTLRSFKNLCTINPNSGPFTVFPGTGPISSFQYATPQNRPDIYTDCSTLKADNSAIRILAYISTRYGQQDQPRVTVAGIQAQVDAYAAWNTLNNNRKVFDGIMWDECLGTAAVNSYYRTISDYARSKGLTIIRGNVGGQLNDRTYLDVTAGHTTPILDIVTIHENSDLTSEAGLRALTFNGAYDKHRFNYIAHTCPISPNPTGPISATQYTDTWFSMAMNYVGTIYITDDSAANGANPWDNVSTYLNRQVNLLNAQRPA